MQEEENLHARKTQLRTEMLQALSHMFCLSHSVIMLRPKHFQALPYSFQVIYSLRTTSYGSRIIRLLFSRSYIWLETVRLAECKGSNLITLRLSYNSTAIELISVPTLPKLFQMSLGMVIYHFLPNPVVINLNSYRKTLSPLYDLVELPNHF